VRLHTTYSFGRDDQDFVVAFETDKPSHFLDLVQELRETKAFFIDLVLRDSREIAKDGLGVSGLNEVSNTSYGAFPKTVLSANVLP